MHPGSDVADLARRAASIGDGSTIVDLLASRPLELWFGLAPTEIYGMLSALPQGDLRGNRVAGLILRVFAPQPIDAQIGGDPALMSALESDPDLRTWYVFAQAAQARLRGDMTEAYERMRSLPDVMAPMRQLIDTSFGFQPFILLQTALTAALSGAQSEALSLYARAVIVAPPPALAFFAREAHLRVALIHALYGDVQIAADHLARAQAVPRTQSWVETSLDAEERVVVALLLLPEQAREAADLIAAVSEGDVGEMWPFLVVARHRALRAAGRGLDAGDRLDVLHGAGFGQPVGSGFAGSVIPLACAGDALLEGRIRRAAEDLEIADPALWQTKLVQALHAIAVGAPSRAHAFLARAAPQTRGLRQADDARQIIAAIAYSASGHEIDALDVLRGVNARPGAVDTAVLSSLAPALATLAAERIDGWRGASPGHRFTPSGGIWDLDRPTLTDRELAVLGELADGATRAAVARALFVSVNTVKTHQRNLYRKLGVSDAAEAVRVARRVGVL